WIHTTDSTAYTSYLTQLTKINHSPLLPGAGADSLADPTGTQTWWGFPTWRETLSPGWNDPYTLVSNAGVGGATPGTQPNGLHPFDASAVPTSPSTNFLPPMTSAIRDPQQLYNDGAGSASFFTPALWSSAWDDDLLMTGVRSFDVKAYDDAYPGYV